MANVNINIRTDAEVKKAAQLLFERLGMDMTTAVNIFLRQAIEKRTLPMEIAPISDGYVVTMGSMNGKIWMADDFDEPLEDFKEYM